MNKVLIRQILGFSVWNLWGSAAVAGKGQGTNILLNLYFGTAVNAAWGIAYQVNNAISSFNQNFITAINPQIIKTYAAEQFEETKSLLTRGAKLSIYLMLFLSLPVILNTEYILNLWLVDVPKYTIIFTKLVLIITIIESITYTIGAAVQASGDIRVYQMLVSGLQLMNLPIAYIALRFGALPFVVLVIALVLSFIAILVRMSVLRMVLNIDIFTFICETLFKPVAIGVISCLTSFLIQNNIDNAFYAFIITSTVCTVLTSILLILVGLSRSEKRSLLMAISSKLH